MDYKEKYEKALERAREIHLFSSDINEIRQMEKIFPDLKEYEDERIRKAMLQLLKRIDTAEDWSEGHYTLGDMIAWFERQGEKRKRIDEDTAWKIYNFVREWAHDRYGQMGLQDALDKHFEP